MDTLKCIETRRSRRRFLNKKVTDDVIAKIIDAAISAPSSMDCQPWHFIVIRNQETRNKLVEKKEPANQEHAMTAPVVILVCVDKTKSLTRFVEDGVTATENILLAAHHLDLGAVYVTAYNTKKTEYAKEIQEMLNIPEDIMPITMIPIGYPDPNEELAEKRLEEQDQIVHWENW